MGKWAITLVVVITTLGRKRASVRSKPLSSAPGRGAQTACLLSRFLLLDALSWPLRSRRWLSHGWSSPSPALNGLEEGRGKEGQGRVQVVACGQARARTPVYVPCFLPAECGALSPGEPTSEVRRSDTAVRPGSQPRLSDPYWALLQQLGGREGAAAGCCGAASGGPQAERKEPPSGAWRRAGRG